MPSLFRDPTVRRFLLGSVLAAGFVWVAIRYYGARAEQMLEFLFMSFVLILLLMGSAFLVFVCFQKLRRLLKKDDGGYRKVMGDPDQSEDEN